MQAVGQVGGKCTWGHDEDLTMMMTATTKTMILIMILHKYDAVIIYHDGNGADDAGGEDV